MAKKSSIYINTMSTNPRTTITPQTQALPGREAEMVPNSAGGVTFQLDVWGQLDRFLILGSDTPTYYASAKTLTKQNGANVIKAIKTDGTKTVNRIAEISLGGRAPKNDPAVFALALCAVHGDENTVKAAYAALPKVCRIGTHLFQFVAALDELGKWNAAAKRGVAAWYTNRGVDKLAVQLLKYQSRDGWAHRDVLRLAHVKPANEVQSALFRYAVKGAEGLGENTEVPQLLVDFERLKTADAKTTIKLIESNDDISWEMISTEHQRDPKVMSALIPSMGMTALIRKLGQLTNIGVIKPLSADISIVLNKINDVEALKGGRVHPLQLLIALKQYSVGHGLKGDLTWKPAQQIVDALNDAFYEAFNFIPTTNEGYLFGLDISGSMFGGTVSGAPGMYPAEVSAVMALAVAKRESNYEMFGFDTRPKPLKISPSMRLDDVLTAMKNLRWSAGRTDCSQPMTYALDNGYTGVNKFCVWTDCETYAGKMQPVEALARYRAKYVKNAKLIVCGMTGTPFTIADPKDPGMLDLVGCDTNAPALIQGF